LDHRTLPKVVPSTTSIFTQVQQHANAKRIKPIDSSGCKVHGVWVSLFTVGDDWSALVAEAEGNEDILKSILFSTRRDTGYVIRMLDKQTILAACLKKENIATSLHTKIQKDQTYWFLRMRIQWSLGFIVHRWRGLVSVGG